MVVCESLKSTEWIKNKCWFLFVWIVSVHYFTSYTENVVCSCTKYCWHSSQVSCVDSVVVFCVAWRVSARCFHNGSWDPVGSFGGRESSSGSSKLGMVWFFFYRPSVTQWHNLLPLWSWASACSISRVHIRSGAGGHGQIIFKLESAVWCVSLLRVFDV